MAENSGKCTKVEEPDSTEVINSLNDVDTEKKLVDKANKKTKDRSASEAVRGMAGDAEASRKGGNNIDALEALSKSKVLNACGVNLTVHPTQ